MREEIYIYTPFIRLDALLKLAGAVSTGGEAKSAIQAGGARVNGQTCTQRGKKIIPGDVVTFGGREYAVRS